MAMHLAQLPISRGGAKRGLSSHRRGDEAVKRIGMLIHFCSNGLISSLFLAAHRALMKSAIAATDAQTLAQQKRTIATHLLEQVHALRFSQY